jgi:hypothetical protein
MRLGLKMPPFASGKAMTEASWFWILATTVLEMPQVCACDRVGDTAIMATVENASHFSTW